MQRKDLRTQSRSHLRAQQAEASERSHLLTPRSWIPGLQTSERPDACCLSPTPIRGVLSQQPELTKTLRQVLPNARKEETKGKRRAGQTETAKGFAEVVRHRLSHRTMKAPSPRNEGTLLGRSFNASDPLLLPISHPGSRFFLAEPPASLLTPGLSNVPLQKPFPLPDALPHSLLPFLLGRAQQCLLQEAFLGSPLHFHRAPGFPSVTISAPDDFLYWTEKF